MIRLEGIQKTFVSAGRELQALAGIDLHVAARRITGLIGPSGAGKSTLLRCVNLLERPSQGRVFVAGTELTALTPGQLAQARRGIGMVFQHPNLMSARTVFDNVALPLELAGHARASLEQRVERLLELVGLSDKRDAYPAQLSGGQRQRVTIARALSTEPDVLLCDEATSALDPNTTRAIVALLRDINQRLGITLLVVSHELAVVRALCDDVALLEAGRIIEQGSVSALFSQPKTRLGREFVDAALGLTLPDEYRARLLPAAGPGSVPLVQLILTGEAAEGEVLAVLARDHGVVANVVSAQTHYVAGVRHARVVSELHGGPEALQRARRWLTERHVTWEELGHVDAHAGALA